MQCPILGTLSVLLDLPYRCSSESGYYRGYLRDRGTSSTCVGPMMKRGRDPETLCVDYYGERRSPCDLFLPESRYPAKATSHVIQCHGNPSTSTAGRRVRVLAFGDYHS